MTVASESTISVIRDTFNFGIVKLPLTGPDSARTPHYGLFRDDNGDCVGKAVSKKYLPHQTEDICLLGEAALEAFGGGDIQCRWNDGHNIIIQPTDDERRAIYGTNDNIFMRCSISAGYAGTPIRASLGMFRDACSNLHIPRQVSGTTAVIRHTDSSRGKMKTLIASFQRVREGWDTLADLAVRMQNHEVQLAGFLDQVYGKPDLDAKRSVTMHTTRTEDIFRRVQQERVVTGRPNFDSAFTVSVWEAFNAVQGFVQHGSRRRGSVSEFDRILLAASSPVTAKAESLAMRLIA